MSRPEDLPPREIESILRFRVRDVYSTAQLGFLFSASDSSVGRMMDAGELPFWRVPGSKYRRIGHQTLKRWLREHPEHWFYRERLEWAEKLQRALTGRTA